MAVCFPALALAASAAEADAGAREIGASSYGFADSLPNPRDLERAPAPPVSPLRAANWPPGCLVNCGPAFGAYLVRRSDVLTSNTADLAAKTAPDPSGHPVGVGGTTMVERLEPDAAGSPMNWVVVSERTQDENGSHSWSLLSGAPDAPWLPSDLYRFEGSSFSADLAAAPSATPEPSTWMMTLIGLAVVTFAGYRNARDARFQ